jgi:hypothetical protein
VIFIKKACRGKNDKKITKNSGKIADMNFRCGTIVLGAVLGIVLALLPASLFAQQKQVATQQKQSVMQQKQPAAKTKNDAAPVFKLTRAQLAQNISFVATMTTTPADKKSLKSVQTFRVELKGKKARMEFKDPSLGEVRYVINDQGTFFYIPVNKAAMQMNGRVEDALNITFERFKNMLTSMKRVGTETVSGIPTAIYKDIRTGAMLYLGTHPGFQLPVKVMVSNVGGTNAFLVSQINLKPTLTDDRFALPKGTQISKTEGGAPAFK